MRSVLNKIYWPIVVFLIVQTFVSSEVFWVMGLLVCLYYVFINQQGKIKIPFREYKTLFTFLLWGFIMGIIGMLLWNIDSRDFIRDCFYYSNPIIFIYLGALYAKKKIDLHRMFNAFIVSSAILCLIQLVIIGKNITSLLSASSVYGWRKISGSGVVVMGIALAIVLSGVIPRNKRLPKMWVIILTGVTASYFIISLSRTNLLVVAIMYAVLIWEKGKTKAIIGRIVLVVFLIIISLVVFNKLIPSEISKAFTEKILSSFSEISFSNTWKTEAEIQGNWRGYETYCAIKQWRNKPLFSQLLGEGFGTRIYVGHYAYSLLKQVGRNGQAISSIAVLHNGYATQLIKLGILGVIYYFYFYLRLIKKAMKARKTHDSIESRVLLSMGLIFLVQTYILNGLFKDYCFFPIIILIGYSAYNIEHKNFFRG